MSHCLTCYHSSHESTHLALRAAPPTEGTLCWLLRCLQVGAPGTTELALRKLNAGVCRLLHTIIATSAPASLEHSLRCEDVQSGQTETPVA